MQKVLQEGLKSGENGNWHYWTEKGTRGRSSEREKLAILLVGGLLKGSGMKDRNLQAVKLH